MIDPAIEDFFSKIDLSRSDWLLKNAKKAKSRAFSTHPSTFSHPDTGVGKKNIEKNTYVTPVKCYAKKTIDGFLRTGNANILENSETIGDAGALKVDKFVKLKMADGKTLLQHIESGTDQAKALLNENSEKYETLRKDFLGIIKPPLGNITNSKIKQVYFPTSDGYHQLSILTNSGMVFELKNRIKNIRSPDGIRDLRDKKRRNEYSDKGFSELYNLVTISYGGSQPQNISSLNIKNHGESHLLIALPPILKKRDIKFPKYNFFRESIYNYEYRDIFYALHKIFKTDYNNLKIREGRDYRIQSLIDLIIARMWEVRSVCSEQYLPENCKLTRQQRVWLCDDYAQTRETEDAWLDMLCKDISGWIIRTYEKVAGKSAFMLGESERVHFHNMVTGNREALR